MDLKKILNVGGERYILVEDAGDEYPISVKCLTNQTILDELLKSGWQLMSLPSGFVKGSLKLSDLPVEECASLTPEQLQDIADMEAVTYSEADLMTKMTKSDQAYHQFMEGSYTINTREELLNFLTETDSSKMDMASVAGCMPLNSFVNPIALFTIEEYLEPENKKWRDLIEGRRVLSIKQLSFLQKEFIRIGLLPDDEFSAKNFMDAYFAWGVCGIRLEVLNKKDEVITVDLSQNPGVALPEDCTPYLEKRVLTYVKSDGTLYRDSVTSSRAWKPVKSKKALDIDAKRLVELGPTYVKPAMIKADINGMATRFYCGDWVVSYNEHSLVFDGKGRFEATHPIVLKKPGWKAKFLPVEFIGSLSTKKEKLFEELYIESLATELARKLTITTDCSTYKALSSLGISPCGVASMIANREGVVSELLAQSDNPQIAAMAALVSGPSFAGDIEKYCDDELSTGNPMYDIIAEFIEDICAGNVNIDTIAEVKQTGEDSSSKMYAEYFSVAHQYLGYELDDIYKLVEAVREDTDSLEFEGNGLKMKLSLWHNDQEIDAYNTDKVRYEIEQAKNAPVYGYVTEAWRELGPKHNQRRHVGVTMEILDMSEANVLRHVKPVDTFIHNTLEDCIQNNIEYFKQNKVREMVPLLKATYLFQVIHNGSFTVSKQLGGKTYAIDVNLVAKLRSVVKTIVESTVNVSRCSVDIFGNFVFFCVNAKVTPKLVVPRKSYSIKEVNMAPVWFNTAGLDAMYNKWFAEGQLPRQGFRGWEQHYRDCHFPRGSYLYNANTDPRGLAVYYKEAMKYKEQYPLDLEFKPMQHPADVYCRTTADIEEDEDFVKRDPSEGAHKYAVGEPRGLTKEDALNIDPTIDGEIQKLQLEDISGFTDFRGFKPEDFYVLKNFDALGLEDTLFDKTPVSYVPTKYEAYFGKDKVVYTDIPEMCERGTYKIKHIQGRRYRIEDVYGNSKEVTV